MIKPVWDKEKGKYIVEAFGTSHEFSELLDAQDYANEVNDYWMSEYDYLQGL